jgi:hypothetical protein
MIDGHESCYSIGVRDPFVNYVTPIWLRFHSDTWKFEEIRAKLLALKRVPVVESGGHLWIPLDVPLNAPSDQMIDSLLSQTERTAEVAYETDGV